jgi:hypothetical protein
MFPYILGILYGFDGIYIRDTLSKTEKILLAEDFPNAKLCKQGLI